MNSAIMAVLIAHLGQYEIKCSVDNDFNYYTEDLIITQTELKHKFTVYEDENCKSAYLTFSRDYQITDFESVVTDKKNILTLNLKSTKNAYNSLTNEVTMALNLINYCDYKEWKTNLETDVSGQFCDEYQQNKIGEKKSTNIIYYNDTNQINYDNNTVPYSKY